MSEGVVFVELPDDLEGESWYQLVDGTDQGRDEGWAPHSGIANLLEDGWKFKFPDSKDLYEESPS